MSCLVMFIITAATARTLGNSTVGDSALHPMCTVQRYGNTIGQKERESRLHHVNSVVRRCSSLWPNSFLSRVYLIVCENMTSSTKPEAYCVLHCRLRSELWPREHVGCAPQEIAHVVLRCASGVDR